jgi:hypothetical protein
MKTEQLQIRVSPQEKEAIRKKAKLANLDMSEWILAQLLPAQSNTFQMLIRNLSACVNEKDRYYAFAEINDFLCGLDSGDLSQAVGDIEGSSLRDFERNYLAAMVELACHRRKVEPPDWVFAATGLPQPHFGSSMLSLRLHLLANSPAPFRKRNIYIDSSVGDRV